VAAVNAPAGGALGFVDTRPCPAWPKPATTTPPRLLRRRQQTIHGDVHDPAAFQHSSRRRRSGLLRRAPAQRHGLQRDDAGAAEAFGEAAARAGLTRIIYLGRLGWTAPTPHGGISSELGETAR
jgi:hypothetical protein